MGNPKRGEVSFFVGEEGDENRRSYIFRFSLNALCTFEASVGRAFMEVFKDWEDEKMSMIEMRAAVRACLKGGQNMTPESVGDLIEEAGFDVIIEKLTEAFEKSNVLKSLGGMDADPTVRKALAKIRQSHGIGTGSSTTQSQPE